MFSVLHIAGTQMLRRQKHRQEKRKLNWHWKEFAQEQWPCKKVMSSLKPHPFFLSN